MQSNRLSKPCVASSNRPTPHCAVSAGQGVSGRGAIAAAVSGCGDSKVVQVNEDPHLQRTSKKAVVYTPLTAQPALPALAGGPRWTWLQNVQGKR